jgi:hypothetical protein
MVRARVLVGSLLCTAAALAAFTVPRAHAQDDANSPAYRHTLNALSNEHLKCSIYYTLVAQCLDNRKEAERVQKFKNAANSALHRAYLLGIEVGLTDRTTAARLQTDWNEQRAAIGNDCTNMGVLNSKHNQSCNRLMEDYEGVFRLYYDEALKKFPE